MGYLQSTGAMSIGTAGGASRSLNRTRNYKRSTSDTANMAMSTLRNWFRSYTLGGSGNAVGGTTGNSISMSNFRGKSVFGAYFKIENESDTTYDNTGDAAIAVQPFYGSGSFNIRLYGNGYDVNEDKTGGTWFAQGSLGGTGTNSRGYTYTVVVTDKTASLSFTCVCKVGLGGSGASVVGSTGTSVLTFTPGSQSSGGYSTNVLFLAGVEDTSGTRYG